MLHAAVRLSITELGAAKAESEKNRSSGEFELGGGLKMWGCQMSFLLLIPWCCAGCSVDGSSHLLLSCNLSVGFTVMLNNARSLFLLHASLLCAGAAVCRIWL